MSKSSGTVLAFIFPILAIQFTSLNVFARQAETSRFGLLRYEDAYDSLLPLSEIERKSSKSDTHFLTRSLNSEFRVGGEIRQRIEHVRKSPNESDITFNDSTWLQRYHLYADINHPSKFRVFAQLYGAFERGRRGGPTPVDANALEFQNLFFETYYRPNQSALLSLSVGRQELQYGSARLISVREGPNVRRSFDNFRLRYENETLKVDGFIARPRRSMFGSFDDKANDNILLWGLYSTLNSKSQIIGNTDVYYLGYQDSSAELGSSIVKEKRHSIGVRAFGQRNNWDWNWEGLIQLGEFGNKDIRAWTLATETGYSWSHLAFKPRLAISSNIASGDANPADARFGTFNPLFPRGNYFSEAAVLGPRNFINVHPILKFTMSDQWTLSTGVNFFWRKEVNDGVYAPSGRLIASPDAGNSKYVASTFSVSSDYQLTDNIDASAVYGRFSRGRFLRQAGSTNVTDLVKVTVRFRF